jgi:DNA-binding XRE family transcriptional regulator
MLFKDWRAKIGLSQSQMAEHLGISKPAVQKIEKGVAQCVPFHLVVKIAVMSGYRVQASDHLSAWVQSHPKPSKLAELQGNLAVKKLAKERKSHGKK